MSVAQLDVALDRPMPQSPDAERADLGSILINNHAFYRVVSTINIEDFFRDAHRTIFATMRRLAEQSREIDPLTLREELSKNAQLEQVGGSAYVASLDAPSEPADVLNIAEKSIYEIAEGSIEKGFVALDRITRTNMTAIEQLQHAGRLLTGIPTGYDRFNEFTSGFQNQDLIIIAARPSIGKTSFMMNIAESIAIPDKNGQPRTPSNRLFSVGVFSLEMSKEQIGLRILSSESGVPNHLIRGGMLSERNWRDLAEASARLAKAKIFVDDTPGIDVMEMRAKARQIGRAHV